MILEKGVNGLSFFEASEDVFAAHQETRMVEGTFPHRTFLGVRNSTVSVEISVPFAVFLVSEVSKCIEMSLFKPFPIFFVFGDAVCEKRSDTSFVVYPPKLHIVFELFAGTSAYVGKVDEAAEFFIPTPFERAVKNLKCVSEKLFVSGINCLIHKEPAVFHRVTGVDGSSCGIVNEFAVRTNGFKNTAEFGLIVDVDYDIRHFLSNLGVIFCLFGIGAT